MIKRQTYRLMLSATAAMIAIGFSANAQTFKERLMKIQKEYAALENVHVEMLIRVFESAVDLEPYFTERAIVKRQLHSYWYQVGSLEMLLNSKYLIMADKASKEIVCTKRSLEGEQNLFSDPFKVNLDSILNFYQPPTLVAISDGVEHYSINQKTGVIKKIDLFIDQSENVLKQMTYLYKEGQYAVIDFVVFNKKPDFENFTFLEGKYIQLKEGKVRPTDHFRGYKIVEVGGS